MQFDADRVRADLAATHCRYCGHTGARGLIELDGEHFARILCRECKRTLEWLGWPPAPEKRERRRTARRADTLNRLGTDHCELCLRSQDDLPPPDKLTVQHVDEDPSNNEPENLRIYCWPCHQLVHWLRTYFGHYSAAQ